MICMELEWGKLCYEIMNQPKIPSFIDIPYRLSSTQHVP